MVSLSAVSEQNDLLGGSLGKVDSPARGQWSLGLFLGGCILCKLLTGFLCHLVYLTGDELSHSRLEPFAGSLGFDSVVPHGITQAFRG